MLTPSRIAQKYFVGAFLSATCVLASQTVHANIIDTTWGTGAGSFELGAFQNCFPSGPCGSMWLPPGDTTITGWTVGGPGNGVDWLTTPDFATADGLTHAVDLQRTSNSSIFTDIPTLFNHVYELSFAAAANSGINANTGMVSAGSMVNQPFSAVASGNFSTQTFTPWTFSFTATGSTTTVLFEGAAQDCCYGPVIDRVSVVAVPEPSTTMLLGMGLIVVIGTGLRRRSVRASEMHA